MRNLLIIVLLSSLLIGCSAPEPWPYSFPPSRADRQRAADDAEWHYWQRQFLRYENRR